MLLLLACVHPEIEDTAGETTDTAIIAPLPPGLSDAVLAAIQEYPTDGSYSYWWPENDGRWWGTPEDLYYLDTLLSPGDPEHRSYCVGLTWQVMMGVVAEELGGTDQPINGMDLAVMETFREEWFVRFVYGRGSSDAMQLAGIGGPVPRGEVRPGDFVQFWRNNGSGHHVVFEAWIYAEDGAIRGFRYRSTQSPTDGIGVNEELFGHYESDVDETFFFPARLWGPEDWGAFGEGLR